MIDTPFRSHKRFFLVNHLSQFFEGIMAPAITTPVIDKYIEMRMGSGAANATINRELSALKRMLNLGAEQIPPLVDKGQTPKIKMLDENNVRKGFFEHDQFLAVRSELPEYLRNFVTVAYKEGWRLDEIETLTCVLGLALANSGERLQARYSFQKYWFQ